jgi:membrane protein
MVERVLSHAWLILRRAAGSMFRDKGKRSAAQIAFFLVLSFPATLLLLVWAFSAVLDDDSVRKTVVDAIVHALPLADPTDRRQVESLLDQVAAGAGAVGWVGAITLLYSASAAVSALRDAVNEAMGTRDARPPVQGKAIDIGLTLVVAPVTIVALGLNLSGELADAIGDHPWLAAFAQFVVTVVVPLVLLFAVLLLLFRVLPDAGSSIRAAWPGALVALGGVVVISYGTELYFAIFGDANAVYGTMGALLAVVFSAYLGSIAIVAGAYVAAEASPQASDADTDAAVPHRRADDSHPQSSVGERLRGLFVRVRRRRRD